MNSQALQKRIIDGKLFSPRHVGDWPNGELRPLPSRGKDDDLTAGATDASRMEHPASYLPVHRIENRGAWSR
jgi:hypothetical protein